MKEPQSIVDAQLQHLLEVVERHRDERCAKVLEQAREQAHGVLAQAHREARGRMHETVLGIRRDYERRMRSARAQQQTRARQRRHAADRELLQSAWQQLRDALVALWRQPESRTAWVAGLVEQAQQTLVGEHWRIEHPADWPEREREDTRARLPGAVRGVVEFSADPAIAAGLRICVEGSCVDATVEGLLSQRQRIESILLARINRQRAGSAPGQGEAS